MTENTDIDPETSDAAFLREVADWIFDNVTPAMGLDQYHVERLQELATRMDTLEAMAAEAEREAEAEDRFCEVAGLQP